MILLEPTPEGLRFCLSQVGQRGFVDGSPSSEDLGADLATGTAPSRWIQPGKVKVKAMFVYVLSYLFLPLAHMKYNKGDNR